MSHWTDETTPRYGWEFLRYAPNVNAAQCAMCDSARPHNFAVLVHAEVPNRREVGACCAAQMLRPDPGDDYREALKYLTTCTKRRRNWLRRKWRLASTGSYELRANRWRVLCFHRKAEWRVRLEAPDGDVSWGGGWPTLEGAKLAAFDEIERIKMLEAYRR